MAFFRTIGVALVGAFAVPVAGFSGLAASFLLLAMILTSEARSPAVFFLFMCASGLCYLAVRTLKGIRQRGRRFVENINRREALAFNAENMLGYPSPGFLVFDKENRKLAICNSVSGDYKIHELSYVLQWYYEWGTGVKTAVGTAAPGGSVMVTQTEYKNDFFVVLEVADENNPFYKFPMPSEASAKRWCAKLNAIFNG